MPSEICDNGPKMIENMNLIEIKNDTFVWKLKQYLFVYVCCRIIIIKTPTIDQIFEVRQEMAKLKP